ncbi:MAG: hypothetical protein ABSC06_36855 [Rhodopila sp.]|jgi:hypothetical protein
MKLIRIAYHRNGVMGAGFHAVAFRYRYEGTDRRMVAAVFSTVELEPGQAHPCNGRLAVLYADYAATGLLESPLNKWRGDDFEPQLRQWIAIWEQDQAAAVAEQSAGAGASVRH